MSDVLTKAQCAKAGFVDSTIQLAASMNYLNRAVDAVLAQPVITGDRLLFLICELQKANQQGALALARCCDFIDRVSEPSQT